MKYKPVFIIGAGRSGTKYLRDALAASPAVARVPFDVGYIWRKGNELLPHDEIDVESVSNESITWIRRIIPKLIDLDEKKLRATILVEKSVPNSLRPLLLYKAFPNATFIHLVRDGRAVTESAMRMWQTRPEMGYLVHKLRYFPWSNLRYGFWFLRNMFFKLIRPEQSIWGPRYKGISEDLNKEPLHVVCARQWLHCVDVAFRQLASIPSDQVITLRYEDVMNGTETLEKLCASLGISSGEVLEYHFSKGRTGENEKWRIRLSQDVQDDIAIVFESLPPSIHKFIFDTKAI